MTKEEKARLDEVRLNQAKTAENIEHLSSVVSGLTDALTEQYKHLVVTSTDVKHIKKTIDNVPSVVVIQKDVESLKVFRSTVTKSFLGLVITALIGFVSYMFNKVQQ